MSSSSFVSDDGFTTVVRSKGKLQVAKNKANVTAGKHAAKHAAVELQRRTLATIRAYAPSEPQVKIITPTTIKNASVTFDLVKKHVQEYLLISSNQEEPGKESPSASSPKAYTTVDMLSQAPTLFYRADVIKRVLDDLLLTKNKQGVFTEYDEQGRYWFKNQV